MVEYVVGREENTNLERTMEPGSKPSAFPVPPLPESSESMLTTHLVVCRLKK